MKKSGFYSLVSAIIAIMIIISMQTVGVSAAVSTQDEVSAKSDYSIGLATDIQKYLSGSIKFSEEELKKYDFNADKIITIDDATVLQKYLAGIITELPDSGKTDPSTVTDPVETTQPTTVTDPVETTQPTTVTEPVETTQPTTVTEPVETTQPMTEPETTEPPEQLVIAQNSYVLGISEQVVLTVTSDTKGLIPTFSSSDQNIAEVDEYGKITALKEGAANIICRLTETNYTVCEVTVKPLAQSISLNTNNLIMGTSEQYKIKTIIPENTAANDILFYSSNPSVATVDSNTGLIIAKSEGTATIVCKLINGESDECSVTVKPAPAWITLNAESITLAIGDQFDLNSEIPDGTATLFRRYSSDDPQIAEVRMGGGIVTAKSVGSTVIKCTTGNGLVAKCTVKVVSPRAGLKLNKSALSLKVGQSYELTASFNKNSGLAEKDLSWSSSNSYIAKVSSSSGGSVKVIPMSQGTASITVTSPGGEQVKCSVTVKGSVVRCIDVSVWQGDIDFNAVKSAGYDYVILRAGFGNETSQEDLKFAKYYRDARAAGLKIGAYWYSYAVDNADALLEAKTCLKVLGDKKLDMPVFFDVEESFQANYSKQKLSDICKTFCDYIYDHSYYYTGVYTSIGWYSYNVDRNIIGSRHAYWVAQIDGDMSLALDFDVHQYTWKLKVDGIDTDVDGDYIYNLNIVR